MESISMRTYNDVQSQSQSLLSVLDMDVTTHLTQDSKQLIREQALPFQPSVIKKIINQKNEQR
jgi:antitoxin component of RelBE/YafQ-DinJ toxin-antitoxin module